MINADELAVCRRRGHDGSPVYGGGWSQCGWCGIWRREVRTFEEREDEPPEDQMAPRVRTARQLARLNDK
jgi:hypothetical protein